MGGVAGVEDTAGEQIRDMVCAQNEDTSCSSSSVFLVESAVQHLRRLASGLHELMFWHHSRGRTCLVALATLGQAPPTFRQGPLCARLARNSISLERLTTRETPSTTPGHTNGTVKMVRGRSRFSNSIRHTHCEKRRAGTVEGSSNCIPPPGVSQICCRSSSN